MRFSDEDKWKTETKTEGGAIQEYLISYQNLVPTTSYTFRVIAYNKYGISLPANSMDAVSSRPILIIRIIHFELSGLEWIRRAAG